MAGLHGGFAEGQQNVGRACAGRSDQAHVLGGRDPFEAVQVVLEVTDRHPAGIKPDDHSVEAVEAVEAALAFVASIGVNVPSRSRGTIHGGGSAAELLVWSRGWLPVSAMPSFATITGLLLKTCGR